VNSKRHFELSQEPLLYGKSGSFAMQNPCFCKTTLIFSFFKSYFHCFTILFHRSPLR